MRRLGSGGGGRRPAEADLAADRDLGCEVELGVDHDGDHRVAAGDRMVGEEEHGQALRGNLEGAGNGALTGQFAGRGCAAAVPVQAHAHPVGLRFYGHSWPRKSPAPPGRTSRRAGRGRRRGLSPRCPGTPAAARGPDDAGFGLATGGKDLAGGQRRRADSGHRVGGTAAQDGRDVHAAAHGEVAAETTLRAARGSMFRRPAGRTGRPWELIAGWSSVRPA